MIGTARLIDLVKRKTMAIKPKRMNERGAAAVEFAIVLPLVLLVIFGGIEYSLLMFNKQILTNASREAARAGIVNVSPRLTAAQIEVVARNYADVNMVTFDSATTGVSTLVTFPASQTFGNDLTVAVSYDYRFLLVPDLRGLFGSTPANTLTLTATTTMRYE